MKRALALAVCLTLTLAASRVGGADATLTDANIITGFDISDSIDGTHMRLQIAGLARAIRSPEVLAAIRRGEDGRVGFAVFAWHHLQFEVVPWTLVATEDDAEAVARMIEARLSVDTEAEVRGSGTAYIGRLTDLSRAIDHAADLAQDAPFASDRAVINIIGNGKDNMGEAAEGARDRVLDLGATVNAVVLDGDPDVLDYYRAQVIGGRGAFLMAARTSDTIVELLQRKFVQDLVAAADQGAAALQ